MSERTGNNKPEPAPDTMSIEPAVWDLFFTEFIPNVRVMRDIKERDAAGKAKYGVRLRLRNGRNAKVDLYQELLDALVYASQDYFEKPNIKPRALKSRIKRILIMVEEVEAELATEAAVRAITGEL